jgi:hypothetical protein
VSLDFSVTYFRPTKPWSTQADNLPLYYAVVKKSGSLNFLDPSGPARPVMGELYLYSFLLEAEKDYVNEKFQ